MSVAKTITGRLADTNNPRSIAAKARADRWVKFEQAFPDYGEMRVLDFGGLPAFWRTMRKPPKAVTVVNIDPPGPGAENDWVQFIQGDACNPPAELQRERFDLVFSNSLIEHVGGPANRQKFADVVQNMADRYWVQTPYRYFPIEPHWLFPGLQFLPLTARATISQYWPLGHQRGLSQTRQDAIETAAMVELVSITEMRSFYPDSEIWFERFAGLVKSLTAIKSN